MQPNELSVFLKSNTELFSQFPDDKLLKLIQGSRFTIYEPNESIIEFGEEGYFLGVIIDGQAEVSTIDDTGEKHSINVLKPGDLFGEISLMTGDKTAANVIGLTPCSILLMPQTLFSSIIMTFPPAIRLLSKTITDRMKKNTIDEEDRKNVESAWKKSNDPYGFKLKSEQPTKILVINCGSSSLKYRLFDTFIETGDISGLIERIGSDEMKHVAKSAKGELSENLGKGTHKEAFSGMISALTSGKLGMVVTPYEITAVGHRVVHGGEKFTGPVIITEDVLKIIEELSLLAPLHNPVNLIGIKEAKHHFPLAAQVAVFDTAFHHTLPAYAYLYGLPFELYEDKHVRRYGFHGMSHFYVALKAAEYLKQPFNKLEVISCHLGNGASLCAIDHGRSIDTSMGFTPTAGLIMGTRCGDVDPGIFSYLMQSGAMNINEFNDLINKQSGLKGLSGISNDMREIEENAQKGNRRAILTFKTFCYQIRKYIGAYMAAMNGLDVVVFTGGIGQGSAGVRSLVCQGIEYMGIIIDEEKNKNAQGFSRVCDISSDGSKVKVLVIPTDEEHMIAREALRVLKTDKISQVVFSNQAENPVPIEISAHHVHLQKEHVYELFGQDYNLTPEIELSQPGQYACKEKVNLIGPKGTVDRVRILAPVRKETQIEIAMTEQFKLGIYPPVRESGDLQNTPGITIEGPKGRVTVDKGVICALRHIHMSPEDALKFGVRDKWMVRVRVSEGDRVLIFGDVLVRVHPNFRLAMHIDTDEGNAAHIATGATGYIEGVQSTN
ncbi:MAG: acetate/propionate family kinase [Desulfobacterales bacterium]|nr:acetate/propionate family kinase [Desulfobacterales bacterium]